MSTAGQEPYRAGTIPGPPRRVPAWLFGVTSIPFGVAGAFTGTTMPFLLRRQHVSVSDIATISALTLMPSTWQFLWAPIVDLGLRRRTWLVVMASLGAACLFLALDQLAHGAFHAFVALAVLGQGLVGMVGSCNGGLMATTLAPSALGRAGGWLNAGNLGAGALGSAATLWLAGRASPRIVGGVLAAMIVLPSLVALTVPEPLREVRSARAIFGGMIRDVISTVKSRQGWTGIVVCLSPVGTAVAINLFSGIADDYHASVTMVTMVNGVANGLLTALGSLLGGWVCDRMNRRVAYAVAGGLTAVVGVVMAFAPLTPASYAWGALVYMLVTGFCYAAFSAMVLEIIGAQKGAAASTQYTLFTAAGNGAIAYVTTMDGWGYRHHGVRGLLLTDAAANFVGIFLLLGLSYALLRPKAPADAATI